MDTHTTTARERDKLAMLLSGVGSEEVKVREEKCLERSEGEGEVESSPGGHVIQIRLDWVAINEDQNKLFCQG